MPFLPESAFVFVAIFSPSLLIFPWQIQYKPICVTCNCASESGSSEPLNLFQFMHVNSSRCNHADASQPMYHPYQRWRCRSVTPSNSGHAHGTLSLQQFWRSCVSSRELQISWEWIVVVERRNCWLALSSEGRGPVCFGHGTDRVWVCQLQKAEKNIQLITLFVLFGSGCEHFFDDAESVGGPHSTKIPCWKMTDAEEKFPIFTDKLPAGLPAVQLLM